ncbi:MAG: hypothetical protein K0R18_292 [Bacillales bacterium]|jgi:ethanolamine utilization protein EutA (predicted chaperonin)|nr:hypothetical protein [Bacillales bacterium]
MRIKPIAFDYGKLAADQPDMKVEPQRKNVVLHNDRYTMWGEHIDPEKQIMMLTSLTVAREYSKDEKTNILTEWENYLHQYATDEQPEEIYARIQERNQKEQEKLNKAKEAADKAAAKAVEKATKLTSQTTNSTSEAV